MAGVATLPQCIFAEQVKVHRQPEAAVGAEAGRSVVLQLVFVRVAKVADQTQSALTAQRAEEIEAGEGGARDQDRRVVESPSVRLQDLTQRRVRLFGQVQGSGIR